jgi:hypothetical protein
MRHVGLVCALASFAAAQGRVWIVDRQGGGQYTEIQPAIDAASPGDRVEVRSNLGYAAFTLSKGIDVDAIAGAHVPSCTVANVAAPESATVWGFVVDGTVTVRQCQGRVLLAALTVHNPALNGTPGASATDSDQVLLVDCRVQGSTGPEVGPGGDGLQVIRSTVVCERSQLSAGAGARVFRTGNSGGNGILVQNGALVAAASTFTGGPGSPAHWHDRMCFSGGPGGSGVFATNSVRMLFMAVSVIVGGPSGGDVGCGGGPVGAAFSLVTSAAIRTADCVITGTSPPMPVLPALPSLVGPGIATRGSPVTWTFSAAPGTTVLPLVDARSAFLPAPGLFVPLLVTPGAVPLLPLVVGGTGSLPFSIPVPAEPTLQDQIVFLQALAFDAGRWSLTPVEPLRIR